MSESPHVTDAEWKVMKHLWRKAPQPAYDIAAMLQQSEGWSQRTVKTLLSRLLKKGVVTHEPYKNLYLYSPAVTEEECVLAESESFLEQVFDNSVGNLMLHFARYRKLSKEEAAELRKILKEQGR